MKLGYKYKEAAQKNWGKEPCGRSAVNKRRFKYLSKEYFDELDRIKKEIEPWKEIEKMDIDGEKVLEIGYGMGCDHLRLAKQGAVLYGIDITEGNLPTINEQILNFAQNYPTNFRTSSTDSLFLINRYKLLKRSILSLFFKYRYPSSKGQYLPEYMQHI